jgi:hypothetical protein
MSIDSNSLWAKELSARPFVERIGKSKSSGSKIKRELWVYIRQKHVYIIPVGSYRIPLKAQKSDSCYIQEINIKK